MRICVNGDSKEVPQSIAVGELLSSLGVDPRGVAVERNKVVVPRSAYSSTALVENDVIEIVRFVGGG